MFIAGSYSWRSKKPQKFSSEITTIVWTRHLQHSICYYSRHNETHTSGKIIQNLKKQNFQYRIHYCDILPFRIFYGSIKLVIFQLLYQIWIGFHYAWTWCRQIGSSPWFIFTRTIKNVFLLHLHTLECRSSMPLSNLTILK